MIERILSIRFECYVYRLAPAKRYSEFIQEQGLDAKSARQVSEFLRSYEAMDALKDVCDAPFRQRSKLRPSPRKSRFSDGSFPVFYSSLEPQTTDAEVKHWIPRIVGSPKHPRTMYYSRIRCNFDGLEVKDLRGKQRDWPKLTHGSDYRFCNKLGAEAIKLGVDAFLAPSARREDGTNVPIFTRNSISNPQLIEYVSVTYDPHKDCTTIESL